MLANSETVSAPYKGSNTMHLPPRVRSCRGDPRMEGIDPTMAAMMEDMGLLPLDPAVLGSGYREKRCIVM